MTMSTILLVAFFLLKMCTEDKFLKDMALDLERANEIDRDLDYYNLSVEKGSFVRKLFIENHSNLKIRSWN